MNIEKTLKNSIISVTGQILTLLLQFVNRRIFVAFLDIEFLGYQSLFSNIFSLLSVAELGIGNIISFHLYKELANNNKDEIGKLMYLYKWIYRIIAIAVLIVGGLSSFFLHYVIKDAAQPWPYLYLIYFLQLIGIVLGYFLSYRRTIYIANQKEYKCVQIDLYTAIVVQMIQLATLAIFKNYILYLLFNLSSKLIANIIISYRVSIDYSYLNQKYSITKDDIQRRNMFSDVKNFVVHKICYAVYGGTDNIVISAFCGIRKVALYGNYYLLQQGIMQVLFYKLLNPVQATIGNIVYSERSKAELWNQFQVLDAFSFFFASYIGIGFLVFFQPAIQIWMGDSYLLPISFVAVYSIYIYFVAVWEIVYKYRSVFGDYAQDRNCMIISAIMNIVVSIGCVRRIGITGVQIGTLVAFFPIVYGRIRFVIQNYFEQSVWKYIRKHLFLSMIALVEGIICYFLTQNLNVTIAGFAWRGLIWVIVPLIGNVALYWHNPYFRELCHYIEKMFFIIRDKIFR